MLIDFFKNNEAILNLFSEPPQLVDLVLNSIQYEVGPCIRINLNLKEFPSNPPKRWEQQEFNKINIEILFLIVSTVNQKNWYPCPIVNLNVTKRNDDYNIQIIDDNDTFRLSFIAEELRINKFNAYKEDLSNENM